MKQEQILKRPVITEKSLMAAAYGKYTFAVEPRAHRQEVAKAIEEAFGVHVTAIKIVNLKGKARRAGSKRKVTIGPARTKAIVRLAKDEKIDLFTIPGQEEPKTK